MLEKTEAVDRGWWSENEHLVSASDTRSFKSLGRAGPHVAPLRDGGDAFEAAREGGRPRQGRTNDGFG
jgi:hypothetical protein